MIQRICLYALWGLMVALPLFAQNPMVTPPDGSVRENQDFEFAMGLLRDGNYQLAFEQFDQFTRKYPKSLRLADAEFYAADALYRHNDLSDALERFERFERAHPESQLADDAIFRQGEVQFKRKRFSAAFFSFKRILDQYPGSPLEDEAAYWVGEAAFNRQDYETALTYYSLCYDDYPEGRLRDYALYSIGFAHEKLGRFEKARQTYRKVIRLYPRRPVAENAATRIAAAFLAEKKPTLALEWLDSLLPASKLTEEAERVYLRAEAYATLGKPADAEKTYLDFLEHFPNHPRAREVEFHLGNTYLLQGKFAKAVERFEHLSHGNDALAEAAFFKLGMAYQRNGQSTIATDLFTKIINDTPGSAFADNALYELAEQAMEQDKADEAISSLDRLVKSYTGSELLADAWFLLGGAYMKANRPLSAVDAFGRTQNVPGVSPSLKADAMFNQGTSLFAAREYLQAAQAFHAFVEQFPDHSRKAEALLWEGESLFKAKKFDVAAEKYQAAQLSTTNSDLVQDAMYGLGWSLFKDGKYAPAAEVFARLVDEYPRGKHDIDALVRWGDALYALKDYTRAAGVFRKTTRIYTRNPLTPYALLQLGNAEFRAGNHAAGIGALKDVLARFPESDYADKAQFTLAWMRFQSKKYEAALEEFRKVERNYPDSPLIPNALYSQGDALYNLGRYVEAEATYRRLVDRFPDNPLVADALNGIQACLQLQNKNAEAATVVEDYLASHPKSRVSDVVEFKNTQELLTQEKYEAAIPRLQKFIRRYPNSSLIPKAHIALGDAYTETGKYEDARREYRTAASLPADREVTVAALLRAGNLAVDGQMYDEGIQSYSAVIETYPGSPRVTEALYRRAQAYHHLKQDAESEQDLRAAADHPSRDSFSQLARIELARRDFARGDRQKAFAALDRIATTRTDDIAAEAQFTLGDLLVEAGRYREAEKALLRVGYVFPYSGDWPLKSLYRLGECYEKEGKTDQAKATYRKILEQHPGTEIAAQAAYRLRRLP